MINTTSWRGKRVLVTGGTGFVGANLVRRLLSEEACVFVLARDAATAWRLDGIRERVTVLSGDLSRLVDVQAAMGSARPSVVFHLATARGASTPADYPMFVAVNTMGAYHLWMAAHEAGVERLVCAGSQLEYGPSLAPHRETDRIQPNTFHGLTKAAACLFLQAAGCREAPSTVILRLFHVYGPWESPKRLIPTAARAALGGHRLLMTGKGIRRDYVYVDDVVDAFLMAADRTDLNGEIFNIGSGHQTPNEEAVAMIERLSGAPLDVEFGAYPSHVMDTTYRVADIEKAKALLGWQPRHALEQGLRATLRWVSDYDREHGTP